MNLQENLTGMLHSFEELFLHQNAQADIATLITAIQQNEAILSIVENSHGSFSTIFLPFHGNTILENGECLIDSPSLATELKSFCEIAATIESTTDTWATLQQEPSEELKQQLLPQLQTFLKQLPTIETFHSWIKHSIR